jgi:hypothetical protein
MITDTFCVSLELHQFHFVDMKQQCKPIVPFPTDLLYLFIYVLPHFFTLISFFIQYLHISILCPLFLSLSPSFLHTFVFLLLIAFFFLSLFLPSLPFIFNFLYYLFFIFSFFLSLSFIIRQRNTSTVFFIKYQKWQFPETCE